VPACCMCACMSYVCLHVVCVPACRMCACMSYVCQHLIVPEQGPRF
jgi:hypothetical protein